MIQVSIEDAYAEACKALGDATVRERLLTAEIQRLTAENEALRQAEPVTAD